MIPLIFERAARRGSNVRWRVVETPLQPRLLSKRDSQNCRTGHRSAPAVVSGRPAPKISGDLHFVPWETRPFPGTIGTIDGSIDEAQVTWLSRTLSIVTKPRHQSQPLSNTNGIAHRYLWLRRWVPASMSWYSNAARLFASTDFQRNFQRNFNGTFNALSTEFQRTFNRTFDGHRPTRVARTRSKPAIDAVFCLFSKKNSETTLRDARRVSHSSRDEKIKF